MNNKIKLPTSLVEIVAIICSILAVMWVLSKVWVGVMLALSIGGLAYWYFAFYKQSSVAMSADRVDIDKRAYEKWQAAVLEENKATREFVDAVKNKRGEKLILEKACACQLAGAELLQVLHALQLKVRLSMEQAEQVNVEFSELFSGRLGHAQLVAKAEDLVDKWSKNK